MHRNDVASPVSFDHLYTEVKSRGLFIRSYSYYTWNALVSITLLCASLFIITLSDNILSIIFSGGLFAFATVQLGMLAHDLSHGAVFTSPSVNRLLAMLIWGLLGGLSETRWYAKHNAHHEEPNHMEHDPDLEIPFVFSSKQIQTRSHFFRTFILPYQTILFWVALPFIYLSNIAASMTHIFTETTMRGALEIILIIVHFILLFYFVFTSLPVVGGIIFLAVGFMGIGIYMSLAFAPNHKGEDVMSPDEPYDWTHQIILTRNIYPSAAVFYLFGGLNFQIEHHLFPRMSRVKYWEASKVVQDFCRRHCLRYHQTTWLESMREIHATLAETALAARELRTDVLRRSRTS